MAFLLDHGRRLRRRAGRTTGPTCWPTAPRSSTAGRTPTTATSPGRRNGTRPIVVSYDSSPGLHRQGRRTATTARCSTPASARWSTPVCWGRRQPRRRRGAGRLAAQPTRCRARCRTDVRLPGGAGRDLPEDWAGSPRSPSDPYEVGPAEIAAEPRAVADRVDGRHLPVSAARGGSSRLLASPRARCWCSASSSCCRWPAWSPRGSWSTAARAGRGARGPGAAAGAPGRWFTVWTSGLRDGARGAARAAGGVRPAPARAAGPHGGARGAARAVRAADGRRRRRLPPAARGGRPAGLPRPRRHARSRSSPAWSSSTSPS